MTTTTTEQPRGRDVDGSGAGAPARRRPWRRQVGLVVVLAVLAALTFGVRHWAWSRTHQQTDDAQVDGPIIPILAKVGGFVTGVRVVENMSVRAGDTLAVLDDRDLRAALQKAEAELQAAIAASGSATRVGQSSAQLSSARARAEEARAMLAQAEAAAAKARRDVERLSGLAQRHIVSGQQLDAAETALRTAEAQLSAAREAVRGADDEVAAAEAGLRAADARVAVARAARDQVELQIGHTVIIAPAAGVVSRKSIEPGQLVQAGQPLMSIVPLDEVWVVANLKETQIRLVRPGDEVAIVVDAYPDRTFQGRVESVSPATGAKFSLLPPDNATGNFVKVVQRVPVRVTLTAAQDSAAPLRPGMSATVTITTGSSG